MNANELANVLDEDDKFGASDKLKEAATMLRQLQERIKFLELSLAQRDHSIQVAVVQSEGFESQVRQQQARIEELKEKVFELEEKLFDSEVIDAETLLNEPVAWMVEDDEDISFIMNGKGLAKPDAFWKSVTPVYIHPAKTLTDEVYFCSRCGKRLGDGIHTCTPPTDILRKASEK